MSANIGFAGIQYRWFIGQVPPDQNERSKNATWDEAHGSRVKVRIPGIHKVDEVTDENLPWAIVAKPTNQGNYSKGSTGIYGGEWVIGFFLDESNQVPVITQVLGKNDNRFELLESKDGYTYFKPVDRYNSGVKASFHNSKSGEKPNSSVAQEISSDEFEKAKPSDPPPNERKIGDIYDDGFGSTYQVIGQNKIEGEFNADGTNKTFNVVKKLN